MSPDLTPSERERYSWQLDVPGFGEAAQRKLKAASVLITRIGGVGGTAALELAAAGVGRLVLAHAGPLRLDDLNRQLLMSTRRIGELRVEQAAERLRDLNPNVEVVAIAENVNEQNADRLVGLANVVVDAAPLFAERYALNRACVAARVPLVEAAMFAMELTVTTIVPGRTACLECIFPEPPPWWSRRFPVLGAIAGTAGCIAATEAIKALVGCDNILDGRMLRADLGRGEFRTLKTHRHPGCPVCGNL